jgi:hypothetical protein
MRSHGDRGRWNSARELRRRWRVGIEEGSNQTLPSLSRNQIDRFRLEGPGGLPIAPRMVRAVDRCFLPFRPRRIRPGGRGGGVLAGHWPEVVVPPTNLPAGTNSPETPMISTNSNTLRAVAVPYYRGRTRSGGSIFRCVRRSLSGAKAGICFRLVARIASCRVPDRASI